VSVVSPAVVDGKSNTLSKSDAGSAWVAGATSEQVLPAGSDGWVEFTVAETNKNRAIGLSPSNSNPDLASIKYAIVLMYSSSSIRIYENGTELNLYSGLATGDVVRVERAGTSITFRVNGKLLPATVSASTTDLVVDASLYSGGATLTDVRASFAARTTSVTRTFDYDHAGRLVKTWHQVNTNPKVLLTENKYNELGQLITKKLHSTDQGATSKQSVDYRYNIRGWLTRINSSDLTADNTNDPRDHFGMNLSYNDPVSTLNNAPQFNGNISAITWSNNQGYGDVKENAYRYGYDPMNRITGADYRQKHTATWGLPQHKDEDGDIQTSDAFSETGYDYDLNGNLQHLTRKGVNGLSMDVLTYDYGMGASKSNRLLGVSDAGSVTQGFVDGNTVAEDYGYDNNGNMVADKNKEITAITYNHLNLPTQVTKRSGDYVKYIYDATGRKLNQQVFNVSGVLQKQSEYAGEYFYENDTLKFINHEEGRIVMTGMAPEYQYHLKDHLGNVRVTFTAKNETETATATMETANASTEQSKFLYYNEVVIVNFDLFDHTNAGATHYSTRLNGSTNERTGLAKSISVMPGDTIRAEVYAKYLDGTANNWTTALTNFIAAVANGTAPAGTVIDGEAIGSTGGVPAPFASLLDKGDETGSAPKAYLNYLVFDRNYKLLDGSFIRVTEAAKENGVDTTDHEKLSKELIIKEPGYVYFYLSNDNVALGGSPVEVYFDDFRVEHVTSPVVQVEDYYPFGLTFNSYRSESSVPNQFQYNGKEMQNELDLGLLDYGARMYNSELGRWSSVDYMSEKYNSHSPYAYALNNPAALVDLDGNDVYLFIWYTSDRKIGHAGIAFDNYRTEEVKDENGNTVRDKDGNVVTKQVADGTVTYYDFYARDGAGPGNHDDDEIGDIKKAENIKVGDLKRTDFGTGQGRAADGIIRVGVLPNTTQYIARGNEKLYQEQEQRNNPLIYNGEKFNCSDFAKASLNEIPGFYKLNGTENVKFAANWLYSLDYDNNLTTPNFLFHNLKKAVQAGPARGAVLKENYMVHKDFANAYSNGLVKDKNPGQ
jgi:RHS repeat-associated protein